MGRHCIPKEHDVSCSLKDVIEEEELVHSLYDACRDMEFMYHNMVIYADQVGLEQNKINALHSMIGVFIDQMKEKRRVMIVLRDFFDTTGSSFSLRDLERIIADARAKEAKSRRHA